MVDGGADVLNAGPMRFNGIKWFSGGVMKKALAQCLG
jgi:hypothetical protein